SRRSVSGSPHAAAHAPTDDAFARLPPSLTVRAHHPSRAGLSVRVPSSDGSATTTQGRLKCRRRLTGSPYAWLQERVNHACKDATAAPAMAAVLRALHNAAIPWTMLAIAP